MKSITRRSARRMKKKNPTLSLTQITQRQTKHENNRQTGSGSTLKEVEITASRHISTSRPTAADLHCPFIPSSVYRWRDGQALSSWLLACTFSEFHLKPAVPSICRIVG